MYLCIHCCSGKHLSGKQRSNVRKAIAIVLKAGFELHDNSQTHYETIVAYLGDDTVTKSRAVRGIPWSLHQEG